MTLTVVNSSHWPSYTEGFITHFAAHTQPNTMTPTDYNTPSAFAWVLFNQEKEEITAARDYLGLEPFFYCYVNQQFIFGTSIPDVLKRLPQMPAYNVKRLLEECFHNGEHFMTPYSNETHYEGVFRLEPGATLHIKHGQLRQAVYWRFEQGAPTIHYANDEDYVEHFGELFNEVVLSQIQGYEHLAAEYSGGLDSTAVITVCHNNRIKVPLFCHVGGGDFSFAESVIEHFKLSDVHYIDASNYEPREQFDALSKIYGGAPPYIYPIMANNIYQAIAAQGKTRILSGFGGDQCATSHANPNLFYSELLKQGKYQYAWRDAKAAYPDKNQASVLLQLLFYTYPNVYKKLKKVGDVKRFIKSYLQDSEAISPLRSKLIQGPLSLSNVRAYQAAFLEGAFCHEVRTRVEYCAVLGKAMGFSHAYPLLHPKIVDFCLRIPVEQKRRKGEGRYLMRRYLSQFVPEKNYKQDKKKGAHIIPAVHQKCKEYVKSGALDSFLQELPFASQIKTATDFHHEVRHKISAYMIRAY